MKRRSFLKSTLAGAAALAAPRIGHAEAEKTITFVPHADLASLDPVWTIADGSSPELSSDAAHSWHKSINMLALAHENHS